MSNALTAGALDVLARFLQTMPHDDEDIALTLTKVADELNAWAKDVPNSPAARKEHPEPSEGTGITGGDFAEAADNTDDAADHDELHAAAAVLDSDPIWATGDPYVFRWLTELAKRHGIEGEW